MAPLYKAAAAFCLVGLSWLQSEANAETKYKYQAAKVDEDAYLTIKLARNGQISAKTSLVEKDAATVSDLEAKVIANETTNNTCEDLITGHLKTIFYHSFDYIASPNYRTLVQEALNTGLREFGEEYFKEISTRTTELKSMTEEDLKDPTATPNYRTLVQEALTTGLTEFGTTYPADASAWGKIWDKENLPSVLHLLGAKSTKVGCVIGNCTKTAGEEAPTKSVLFCELSPAVADDEVVFGEEYFKELSTRKTELKDMKEEDLEDPIVTSSADAAVPSILTAGLVAILAAISA
ncbi:uncharacterized protein EMH_0078230 [Eimeria mitis]|uniref:SAG family member n=1 Tax=Eimeria mitis TaxID=44415 RepID=U6JNA2_9EIME|nr:uncharacterized protein EMH_0078230 [Eimeria mitis]CDJ26994.1 hypothetical protein EMH_0078230 [Eimeria mitis]